MVQVIDKQVVQTELPSSGYLKNGESVSGYNLLPSDILKEEGWLPLEQTIPIYDEKTQYLQHDNYAIKVNKVVETFIIVAIPERF